MDGRWGVRGRRGIQGDSWILDLSIFLLGGGDWVMSRDGGLDDQSLVWGHVKFRC